MQVQVLELNLSFLATWEIDFKYLNVYEFFRK
jgi:hypothetical protein